MDDEAGEVDEEEVVRVPEDLKVVPADELGGGRHHEDERQRDDDACQPRDGGEGHILDGLQGRQDELGRQGTGGGGGLDAGAGAHCLVGVDGVQPLVATLQVHLGEDGREAAIGGLLAVVVALHVEEVGDGVHGWAGDRRSVTRLATSRSLPCPSPARGSTCEQGQCVGHQLVEGEVVVQLLPQCPPAALRREAAVSGQGWGRGWGRPRWPCRCGALTEQVPRRKERRLRQTGRRISMLLKLRHLADARAHAKADWGEEGGECHCPVPQMGYVCLQPRCPPRLCPAWCCARTGMGWDGAKQH